MDKELAEKIQRVLNIRLGIESRRRKNRIEGAINWADLRCCDVEYVTSMDGDSHYRAIIEEAAPNCYALISAMYDQLRRNDITDTVVVVTEW